MTLLRLRIGVFAGVLAAASLAASAQAPPQDARRPPHRSPPTRCHSRCRSIPRSSSARCRTACATTCARTAKPAHRAELRLVVKAGSVLEDDDQQGLAHFVEHMEFEGTEHFPRQSIIDFLSSLGLSIGADANAATSYDDTQYTLRVPTDVPGVARSRAARARGLGARRHVRPERHRSRARHRPLRMADAPRRRRAHAGQDPPRAARRIALRGSAADRQARHHRARAARAADALLPRLVPARSDGRDRRRRRRSRPPSWR